MVSRSRAFCPGHITAFFEIIEDEEVLKKGSRGAGLCLSKGVFSTAEVEEAAEQEIVVILDGNVRSGTVTELAVRKMLGDDKLRVEIQSENQLPISQGFGMSGAGALSSVFALNCALGSPRTTEELTQFSHAAEVESHTGLGDAYPQSSGGMVVREVPGAPPFGRIKRFDVEEELVLCILGDELETKDILLNGEIVRKINESGKRHVDSFILEPTLKNLFSFSGEFAVETELATEEIAEAIEESARYGSAGMSMLGNSIFAHGDVEMLVDVLGGYGTVVRCSVDNEGARKV